jgi:hypothetical protein
LGNKERRSRGVQGDAHRRGRRWEAAGIRRGAASGASTEAANLGWRRAAALQGLTRGGGWRWSCSFALRTTLRRRPGPDASLGGERRAARSSAARTVRRRHKAAQEQGVRGGGLGAAQLNRRAAFPCWARTPGRTSAGLRRSPGGGRRRMGLDGLRAGCGGAGLAMRAGVG